MPPFRHRFRIRYHECDQQGHVFNAHYFSYFDVALTELWRAAFPGGYQQALAEYEVDMVVADARARFLGSARFDDLVDLEVELTRVGTTSTTATFTLIRDGGVLVEGELRHVYMDVANWKKTAIPDGVRAALEPYTSDQAQSLPPGSA